MAKLADEVGMTFNYKISGHIHRTVPKILQVNFSQELKQVFNRMTLGSLGWT